MNKNKIIVEFLYTHPLISVSGLEQELSLPPSTIAQALGGGREIPKKHLEVIINKLKEYGLKEE